MEAIREIKVLDSNKLTIELPESFAKALVEVVVLRIATDDTLNSESIVKKNARHPQNWKVRVLLATSLTHSTAFRSI